MESGDTGLRLGVSDDFMAVVLLVPGKVSVQEHSMPSCYGNALPKEVLCKSLISFYLDLRHVAPRDSRILMQDNHNISPTLLLLSLPT